MVFLVDKESRAISSDQEGNRTLKRGNKIVATFRVKEGSTYDGDGKCISEGDVLNSLLGLGRFYVYALIDPRTEKPFYIGKGTANRATDHFRTANVSAEQEGDGGEWNKNDEAYVGATPEEVLDTLAESGEESEKTQKIRELLELGFTAKEIARVVARRVSEEVAFALESLLIKSVFGRDALTNIADGHHSERFRLRGSWGCNALNFSL